MPPKKAGGKPSQERVPIPFQEIDSCWAYIGYVQMLQYHVESEAEVRRKRPWRAWRDARDTDILLDVAKLTTLLRVALERGGSGAFAGSGTLSALNA